MRVLSIITINVNLFGGELSTATAAATTTPPSGFYLIPESDLFGCEIWIC